MALGSSPVGVTMFKYVEPQSMLNSPHGSNTLFIIFEAMLLIVLLVSIEKILYSSPAHKNKIILM